MNKTPRRIEFEAEIVRKYLARESSRSIANSYRITSSTVLNILRNHNIARRERSNTSSEIKAHTKIKSTRHEATRTAAIINAATVLAAEKERHAKIEVSKQLPKICPKNMRNDLLVSLSTGTKGAINEMAVCVDLMKRGFHVYRAISPSCPCDLVIWFGPTVLRVEVKGAYYNRLGSLQNINIKDTQRATCEIVAAVTPDGIIHYNPLLPDILPQAMVVAERVA
jgi:hypothetical protein